VLPKLTVPSLRADIGGVVQLHRLPFIEAIEPRPIHFALYTNEDGTEVSIVQVHPDADSMAFHVQVASEHFAQAYEFLDTTKCVQIYRTPGDTLLEQMKQISLPGFL